MVNVKFDLPAFTNAEAEHIAEEAFGKAGRANSLPGERDQNFRLTCADASEFVLKISHAGEDPSNVELQNLALEHVRISAPSLQIPRLLRARSGEFTVSVPDKEGKSHFVRLLSYIPARLFADVKPHSRELLRSLGEALGELDCALQDFSTPYAKRELKWDPSHASWIRDYLSYIPEGEKRETVFAFLDLFESDAMPLLATMRQSVIYNDANDYNILVGEDRRVIGFVDFGDLLSSATVCDPAVAIAYAMLGKPDPLSAAVDVVERFHRKFGLNEAEIAVLFPLACARLCITVTNSAYQRVVEPKNPYLTISETPAWSLLMKLAHISPAVAHARFRFACGYSAARNSVHANWREMKAHPIVECDLQKARVLDLSVGSAELGGFEEMFDRVISLSGGRASVTAAIGRYNEARVLSPSPAFRMDGNDGPEWRSIHLGIDIFLPPGTPVFSPLDATIHSFRNNSASLDYGPTIVLQHKLERSIFYTLFGHLSAESLQSLREGQTVRKGQRIGSIGGSHENGGWPPHVHFQVITDLLEMKGDFIGNAAPSQREFWIDLCPDPGLLLDLPYESIPSNVSDAAGLLRNRNLHLSSSLSISYDEPLQIVRGYRQYLYDENGRAYLDCVNNVAHVGHCHPAVVRAGQEQMAILNTNTRYLHELIVRYADRLTQKFPAPLRVCFFVNSGSEANELALRLARAHTQAKNLIVLESGYHGNTTSLIDVSHYKFAGPGGGGAPNWVHVVPLPDLYRGLYKGDDPHAASKYAAHVLDTIQQLSVSGRRLCGFLAESMPGVAGQIILPSGYLEEVYSTVRKAGGVCIADEVQTGFGRPGSHFWAFETQGVVPDIVTLGKPIGNGHPLGAVITTPEIARSFANGMEYFNTFGGNPVSCAIGLAVLDVLEKEELQKKAAITGAYLLKALVALKERHALLGDIRGSGLYIGIELVNDRHTLNPASKQAEYIVNRMRQHAVLLSTDGPMHNVLKIKPPLVFTQDDADFLCVQLEEVLQEDGSFQKL